MECSRAGTVEIRESSTAVSGGGCRASCTCLKAFPSLPSPYARDSTLRVIPDIVPTEEDVKAPHNEAALKLLLKRQKTTYFINLNFLAPIQIPVLRVPEKLCASFLGKEL